MKIVLIGAGNVGYHLGIALWQAGVEISQVFSRKLEKAAVSAQKTGAIPLDDLAKIDVTASVIIIAVHDDAIGEVARQIANLVSAASAVAPSAFPLITHTSGATPLSVFERTGLRRVGVFYPLQTFSMGRQPDFSQIPMCVDANNAEDLGLLIALAKRISPTVQHLDDRQRAMVHVAAVFVNNFTNHLYTIGETILKNESIPFELLLPLIRETAAKLSAGSPAAMQTGPAARHDEATIRRHLDFLEKYPAYRELYHIFTDRIQRVIT